MTHYVLMAQDGHRENYECWHPVAVFTEKPSLIAMGRVLISGRNAPWDHREAIGYSRNGRRIMDFCQLAEVRS